MSSSPHRPPDCLFLPIHSILLFRSSLFCFPSPFFVAAGGLFSFFKFPQWEQDLDFIIAERARIAEKILKDKEAGRERDVALEKFKKKAGKALLERAVKTVENRTWKRHKKSSVSSTSF